MEKLCARKLHKAAEDLPLNISRAFIIDDCDEVVPECLNFVKGVAVSEDRPEHHSGNSAAEQNLARDQDELCEEVHRRRTLEFVRPR